MMHNRSTRSRGLRLLALGLIIPALALTSCSATPSGGGGDTTLTFFSWNNEEQMTPVIEAFEAANPGIIIEFSTAPPVAEYVSTLQNRLGSGTAADVFIMAAENKTNLVEGGFVVELTDEPFMAVTAEKNRAAYASDGRDFGLSISSWAAGLMYNEDLLAASGYDTFPTNWDDFVEMLAKLKADGVTPLLESWQGMPTTVAASVGFADAEAGGGTDARIFEGTESFEELWTEPLERWNALFEDGLISRDVVGLTGDQVKDEFVNGRVAIIPGAPWDIAGIRETAPDINFAIVGVPQTSGDPYFAGAAGVAFAINSEAKEPEAALAFLTFLASDEGIKLWHESTSDITTTSNFEPTIDPALDSAYQALLEGSYYLPQISWVRYQDSLYTEVAAQLQLMAQGQVSPADVGKALDAKLAQESGE